MLKLFLDDAGSQDNLDKPIFAVGGYVAPAEVWDSFTLAWQSVLDDLGASSYHATDCEPGSNGFGHRKFATWNIDRLLELKRRLAPLTHQLSAGAGRGLVVPEHDSQLLHDRDFVNRIDGARKYLPLFLVLEAALDWVASEWPDRPQGEKIAVIFEGGTKGLALARSMFKKLREQMTWAKEVYTDTLGSASKDFPPMQAADMLAFEAYKNLEGMLLNPPRPERKILSVLRQPGRLSFKHVAPQDYTAIRELYLGWLKGWKDEGGT